MSITTNLIRQVLGDGARNTKYDCVFQFSNPSVYSKNRDAAVLVKTASFPGKDYSTVNLMYKGRVIPIRGQVRYTNTWECTFYLPENHDLKLALESWLEAIDETVYFSDSPTRAETSTRRKHHSSGYTAELVLYQLNINENKRTARYVLHNAFPISVRPISVSSEGPSAIEELSVTFSYSHYTTNEIQHVNLINQSFGANSEFVSDIKQSTVDLMKGNLQQQSVDDLVRGFNSNYTLPDFVALDAPESLKRLANEIGKLFG